MLLDARLLADINPAVATNSSFSGEFIALEDNVLFAADSCAGRELWKTDGTAAGTEQIKDIHPAPHESSPSRMFELDGNVYFDAVTLDDSFTNKAKDTFGTIGGGKCWSRIQPNLPRPRPSGLHSLSLCPPSKVGA